MVSNKNGLILDLFKRFIQKNKANVKTVIQFGKYAGERLEDIPAKYLIWLKENKNVKYCKCYHNTCKNCQLYQDIDSVLRYSLQYIEDVFRSMYGHEGMRYFDYTFTDFVQNYNKTYNQNLLTKLHNKLDIEDLKLTLSNTSLNFKKYTFIDDD
jgi:hypothetical protein